MPETARAKTAAYDQAQQRRRALLAKVHLGKKELRLDDVAYRAMLKRLTGSESAAELSPAQLGQVLDEMKAKGFAARRPEPKPADGSARPQPARRGRAQAQSPAAKKARALWISLHQLGAVREPSEKALESFGRRQLGVDRLQWADPSQMYRLIEALKAMAERAGWSQDVGEAAVAATLGGPNVPALVRDSGHDPAVVALKIRLLEQLWFQLIDLGVVEGFGHSRSTVGLRQYAWCWHPALFQASPEELDGYVARLAKHAAEARTKPAGTPA